MGNEDKIVSRPSHISTLLHEKSLSSLQQTYLIIIVISVMSKGCIEWYRAKEIDIKLLKLIRLNTK